MELGPLTGQKVESGVTNLIAAGHDKGVAYRFFVTTVLNKVKSEEAGIDLFDEIDMIEWLRDRREKPVERVTMIGDKLLKFRRKKNAAGHMELVRDANGVPELMGGLYAEDYKRFKQGLASVGLPLDRWGALSLGSVETLKSEGVFTVEQLAAMPRDRIEGRFPKSIVEAFESAIRYVNREQALAPIKEHATEVMALKQANSKANDRIEALEQKILELQGDKTPKVVKRGRPKKIVDTEESAA